VSFGQAKSLSMQHHYSVLSNSQLNSGTLSHAISMFHQRFFRLATIISGAVLLQACTTSSGQRAGTDPNSVIAIQSQRSDSAMSIAFPNVFRTGTLTYDFTSSSIVQSTSGDSIPQADTSDAAAVLTVSFSGTSGTQLAQIMVQVDSARVVGQNFIHRDTLGPYIVTVIPRRAIQISRPATQACNLENSQLLAGDEILPALPIGNELPTQWTDTTRYELCRGGIPLRVTRVAQYRPHSILLEHQDDSITIIRSTVISLEGRGVQWQQPVNVIGRGASTDTLTIVQQRLRKISGTTNVELTFRSAFRTQSFRQSSNTDLSARP